MGKRIGRPPVAEGPTRPISATVEVEVTKRFDEVARSLNLNRSEAMRLVMRQFIAAHPEVPESQSELPIAS